MYATRPSQSTSRARTTIWRVLHESNAAKSAARARRAAIPAFVPTITATRGSGVPATKRTFATEHIAEPREQRIELLSASFGPMRASRPCDEQQRAPFSTKD